MGGALMAASEGLWIPIPKIGKWGTRLSRGSRRRHKVSRQIVPFYTAFQTHGEKMEMEPVRRIERGCNCSHPGNAA